MGEIGAMIEGEGLTAPRLTPEHIESVIRDVEFIHHEGSTLTICIMTLRNGFKLVGKSAAASPENYRQVIGEAVARKDAAGQIWALEGYLLRERLYREELAKNTE
jgi:hypothetical protein